MYTAASRIPQTSENRRNEIVEPRHRVGTSVRRHRDSIIYGRITACARGTLRDDLCLRGVYTAAVAAVAQVATYEISLCAERCVTRII